MLYATTVHLPSLSLAFFLGSYFHSSSKHVMSSRLYLTKSLPSILSKPEVEAMNSQGK